MSLFLFIHSRAKKKKKGGGELSLVPRDRTDNRANSMVFTRGIDSGVLRVCCFMHTREVVGVARRYFPRDR